MIPIKQKKAEPGFALLITILVLGVVVAVTLGLVELSLKQLKLSVDSTDSEIAFHAANAGLECAKYTRNKYSNNFENGTAVTFNCFNLTDAASRSNFTPATNIGLTTGKATLYQGEITWGSALAQRCTEMKILAIVATSSVVVGSAAFPLANTFSGYVGNTKTCDAGERCTVMSVTGYSSACNATSTPGVLKREILLEL
jgi:Tfp pilus assembly protein PilX